MKMTKFNKDNLPALRVDLNAALKAVAAKYGLEITVGSCRFQTNSATWKLETAILGSNGENKQAAADWNSYAVSRGFDKEDLGATFTDDGQEYEIQGWLPRRRKYPVQVKNLRTGKVFIYPSNRVLSGLGKTDKIQPSFSIR